MNKLIFLPFMLLGSLVGTPSEPISLSLQNINNTAKNWIPDFDDGGDETGDFTLTGYTSVLSDLADINYIHDGSDSFSFISLEEQKQANTNSHKVFVYLSYLENSINGQNYNAWYVSISTFYQLEKSDDEIFVNYPIRLVSKSNTLCKFEIGGGINENTAARRRYRLLDFRISYNGVYQYLHLIPGSGYEQAIDEQFFFEDDVTNIEDATELTTDEIFSNNNTLDGYSSIKSDLNQVLDIEEYSSDGIFEFLTLQEQYYKDNTHDVFIYLKFNPEQLGFDNWYANISTVLQPNEETPEAFILYPLTLVSRYGYYLKFKVGQDDINQNTATTRRYYVNDIKIKTSSNTYNSIFAYFNLNKVEEEFYFNGTNADNLESVHGEYEIVTVTNKAIYDVCYGESEKFFGIDFETMDTGNVVGQVGNLYTDDWYVFFNTDHDHDISELLELSLTYTQIDFENLVRPSGTVRLDHVFTESEIINAYPYNTYHFQYLDPVTKVIQPGIHSVSTVSYFWFNIFENIQTVEVPNIMDIQSEIYQDASLGTFVFSSLQDEYRWAVNFTQTERQATWAGGGDISMDFIRGSTMSDVAILKLTYFSESQQKTVSALTVDNPSTDEDLHGVAGNADDTNWFVVIAQRYGWFLLIGIAAIILIIILVKRFINRPRDKNKVEIVLKPTDSYRYFPNVRKKKKD